MPTQISQITFISLVLSALISQYTVAPTHKYDSNTQDAWLYPGLPTRGVHLTYSDTTDWSDLWKTLSENGFYTVGTLCTKGVFILYQQPLYVDWFDISRGRQSCRIIRENTKSVQLVGSVGHMHGPSITFFQEPYFGSAAYATVVNVGSEFFQKMEYTRSAIIIGEAPWAITLSTGKTICVQPEFDTSEKKSVCLVQDFAILLDTEEAENDNNDAGRDILKNNTVILKASLGCDKVNEEESIYRIQECLYWEPIDRQDVSAMELNVGIGEKLGARSDISLLPTSRPNLCNDDDSAKRVLKLYKAVTTKNFDSDVLVGLDIIGKHSWKLDLLDWIYTIVVDVIPDNIVPTSFFNKARELFVHKLVTAWNKDESVELKLQEKNYKFLLLLTERCETAITEPASNNESLPVASQLANEFASMWNNIHTMDDFKDFISPEFIRIPSLDIITEIFWIVGHMALHLCHAEHMTTSHFWALYLNTFWNLYILPIVPDWHTQTQGLNFFFGGLDPNEEYNKLAMFVGATRKRARNMELLQRPEGVKK